MDIVCIPGYCDTKSSFSEFKKDFPEGLAIDLPGFGAEEKPNVVYNKKLFLHFLRKKITKKTILLGFSMGALLAKDFTVAHPELVEKIFLISYPLQKSKEVLTEILRKRPLARHYVDRTLAGNILCNTHWLYRWFVILYVTVFKPRYRYSIRGWFEHTYHSALSTMQDYVLQNDPMELKKIKDKTIVIVGEHDDLVDKALLDDFKSYVIPDMGHAMFGYENQIANIIKENI